MFSGRGIHRYTYADYVALELQSPTKHEFLHGEIYAMAGRSEEHPALAATVLRVLGDATSNGLCRVHTSDLRVYVESVGLATFPDGTVICGPLQQHPPSPNATALNPRVLVEVTSDSSEEYDRGEKAEYYRTIASLREYVIVSHRERPSPFIRALKTARGRRESPSPGGASPSRVWRWISRWTRFIAKARFGSICANRCWRMRLNSSNIASH